MLPPVVAWGCKLCLMTLAGERVGVVRGVDGASVPPLHATHMPRTAGKGWVDFGDRQGLDGGVTPPVYEPRCRERMLCTGWTPRCGWGATGPS